MNLLIVGDSFSADWSAKFNQYPGWPNLLNDQYSVVNLSQAGCSEYRILKQLESVGDFNRFDLVIVAHTSPDRIFTSRHPLHHDDLLHHHCDLIFTDLDYHYKKPYNFFNRALASARNFFVYHYDKDHFLYVYDKVRQDIDYLIGTRPSISMTFFGCVAEIGFSHDLDFSRLFIESPGLINHLSESANVHIFQEVNRIIKNKISCRDYSDQ